MEKYLLPAILVFSGYLYMTRDNGFDFATASPERRTAFVERQGADILKKGGLLPPFRSQLLDISSASSSRSVVARIALDKNAGLLEKRGLTKRTACIAYNISNLPEHDISMVVRFERETGGLIAAMKLTDSACQRFGIADG